MGMKQTTSVVQEEEMWSTVALKDAAFSFQGLQNSMKTGNEQLDKLIDAQKSKAQGFPLKMISSHSTTDGRGQTHESKTTMEVTSLKSADTSASLFKLPTDYEERNLSPFGAQMGGSPSKQSGAAQQGGDNPFLKMLQEQLKKQQ